ncbi:AAA family ATPase (plasmid) [Aneurinibacillus sp. Ricciae_BoGa-3]|uniref:AAA family ATPase n=1 Tax=Aneurinibacillus sp. Ricciae_BoGa-3 TaxID=3022697 RepID=UPI002342525B|nr:AAA family ATPase [Aneurinibacillus sp. Ricciae_BoGa-3]WCK57697.1 AAA family ATPase [Aneurinibacillus sp. Ricciae_BoGa-3]
MESKAKIITVYPVLSGNGAKFIATNLAHYLKGANSNKRIALVDFNLKNPYLAHAISNNDEIHGIDNLIDRIDGNILTQELFLENMVAMRDNVEVLKGTKLIGKHKVFTEKHIRTIIQHLRDIYDFVVIAVAPETDNAGTVYGIHEADSVVMVAKTNIANVKSANRVLDIIRQYKKSPESVKLVYNMYTSGSGELTNFVKDNNIEVIGVIEYDENAVDNMDLNGGQSVRGLFKSKNRNQDTFTNMLKSL